MSMREREQPGDTVTAVRRACCDSSQRDKSTNHFTGRCTSDDQADTNAESYGVGNRRWRDKGRHFGEKNKICKDPRQN